MIPIQQSIKSTSRTQVTTLNLPVAYVDALDRLLAQGVIPSRSEGVRQAITSFLASEPSFRQILTQVGDTL